MKLLLGILKEKEVKNQKLEKNSMITKKNVGEEIKFSLYITFL